MKNNKKNVSEMRGAGAAGGIGAAMLGFLRASARSGADLVIEAVNLADRLRGAMVVIAGEGCIDRQSLQGKARLVGPGPASRFSRLI